MCRPAHLATWKCVHSGHSCSLVCALCVVLAIVSCCCPLLTQTHQKRLSGAHSAEACMIKHIHTHLPITVVRSACVCARMRVHEHKHLEPCLPVLGADNAAPPALVSLYCQASTYKTNPNPYPQTLVSVVTLRSGCRNPLK